MKSIKMYTSAYCPYCLNAEKLFSKKGITDIKKIRVDIDSAILEEMIEKNWTSHSAANLHWRIPCGRV